MLLGQRGTAVTKLTTPADAASSPSTATVLVVDADDLSDDQLQALSGHRVVLVDPDVTALAAFTSSYQQSDVAPTDAVAPGCSWPGSVAGPVTFPDPTTVYSGPSTCYGGAVVITDRLVVLGSADLLRNDQLAKNDIAALDLNAISDNGAATSVQWLMPGIADAGSGSPSIWVLFPDWAQRAFWWLLIVGVITALWRGRRLGPVVDRAAAGRRAGGRGRRGPRPALPARGRTGSRRRPTARGHREAAGATAGPGPAHLTGRGRRGAAARPTRWC